MGAQAPLYYVPDGGRENLIIIEKFLEISQTGRTPFPTRVRDPVQRAPFVPVAKAYLEWDTMSCDEDGSVL